MLSPHPHMKNLTPRPARAAAMPAGRRVRRLAGRLGLLAIGVLVGLLGLRVYNATRGPDLELWHTYVPSEPDAASIDRMDWRTWMEAEDRILASVRTEVTERLPEKDRIPVNRYFAGSAIYPAHFAQDWNRSWTLLPQGAPRGAVVLLHGLTDSPYSLRHIGRRYHEAGFAVVAIRLPAHGTVPAALAEADREDWYAAARLAVRAAVQFAGGTGNLHIVGFSNGGALALNYALEALERSGLARPTRLVLISPMLGITAFARFAGLAGLPALLPRFAAAAWLGIVPEFNPFKYNSFPVNGARQSWRVTQELQARIRSAATSGRLAGLPPVQTFHSVLDSTVSSRAVIQALYALLPEGGHELVLFDINRHARLGLLFSNATETAVHRLLPPAPRSFRTVVIGNEAGTARVSARIVEAGATAETVTPLGLAYPADTFSLSHVALPFPPSDGLYGSEPDPAEDFGINLGAVAPRGERGALIVGLDALLRRSSNPFFPYLIERIAEGTRAH